MIFVLVGFGDLSGIVPRGVRSNVMAVEVQKHLFTVREFHQMAEGGVFAEDDRVELLGGEIFEMTPIGSRHAGWVNYLSQTLTAQLGSSVIVSVQNPFVLDNFSEPQPDLLILRPRSDFYSGSHPTPEDVRVVIEVADSSESFDRRAKLPRYAQAGIPEAWLIVLNGNAVDVYDDPSTDGYRAHRRFERGEQLTSRQFPSLTVVVSELV
jgi:Uma2 family endonuclease